PRPGATGTEPASAWRQAWVARWTWAWGVRCCLERLRPALWRSARGEPGDPRDDGSGGCVVRAQRAVGAQEPFAGLRLELRAGFHRRLVDVQRDRDLVAAGVGDG